MLNHSHPPCPGPWKTIFLSKPIPGPRKVGDHSSKVRNYILDDLLNQSRHEIQIQYILIEQHWNISKPRHLITGILVSQTCEQGYCGVALPLTFISTNRHINNFAISNIQPNYLAHQSCQHMEILCHASPTGQDRSLCIRSSERKAFAKCETTTSVLQSSVNYGSNIFQDAKDLPYLFHVHVIL